jgi:tRNA U34 5-methylaminomethyl-2-thiouridine-forming methyltransferase MnmC
LQQSLIITEDGSHSLRNELLNETYHSIHGAIQESVHVFIENGLKQCPKPEINILEIGFGTGLNAFLTLIEAEKQNISIHYTGIELYPVSETIWREINYPDVIAKQQKALFYLLHACEWGKTQQITPHFSFRKMQCDFAAYEPEGMYDLIYFDAFSPEKQPELWLNNRFSTMAAHCNPGAILTTYCAKGIVKQALREAGFKVERLEGPPGKRHMLRGRLLQQL